MLVFNVSFNSPGFQLPTRGSSVGIYQKGNCNPILGVTILRRLADSASCLFPYLLAQVSIPVFPAFCAQNIDME